MIKMRAIARDPAPIESLSFRSLEIISHRIARLRHIVPSRYWSLESPSFLGDRNDGLFLYTDPYDVSVVRECVKAIDAIDISHARDFAKMVRESRDNFHLGVYGAAFSLAAVWILKFVGKYAKQRMRNRNSQDGMIMQYIWHIAPKGR